jgi:serine/threonine-protein kinase
VTDALPEGAALQNGAFVVECILAQSSFAITYAARDEKLRRAVALKELFLSGCRRDLVTGEVLPAGLLSHREFENERAHFLAEARALAPFRHPHIVAVHAFFEEHNTAYMAMEYLRGQTLLQVLETRGRLPEKEVLRLAAQLCEAIEAVHGAHRLHRDLKPENVMLAEDGRIVLLDFGLSTHFDGGDAYGTRRLDAILRYGTPGYAPLEQYTQSGAVSTATDVYALGATLYHLLTGQAPPPATDRAFGARLEAPHRLRPGMSAPVSDAILWALRMKPESRPPTVQAFAERLFGRDNVQLARVQLLGVLVQHNAALQQQEATRRADAAMHALQSARSAPAHPPTGQLPAIAPLRNTAPLPPDEDSGCWQAAIVVYFVIWAFAAIVGAIAFLARLVMFGW